MSIFARGSGGPERASTESLYAVEEVEKATDISGQITSEATRIGE